MVPGFGLWFGWVGNEHASSCPLAWGHPAVFWGARPVTTIVTESLRWHPTSWEKQHLRAKVTLRRRGFTVESILESVKIELVMAWTCDYNISILCGWIVHRGLFRSIAVAWDPQQLSSSSVKQSTRTANTASNITVNFNQSRILVTMPSSSYYKLQFHMWDEHSWSSFERERERCECKSPHACRYCLTILANRTDKVNPLLQSSAPGMRHQWKERPEDRWRKTIKNCAIEVPEDNSMPFAAAMCNAGLKT